MVGGDLERGQSKHLSTQTASANLATVIHTVAILAQARRRPVCPTQSIGSGRRVHTCQRLPRDSYGEYKGHGLSLIPAGN